MGLVGDVNSPEQRKPNNPRQHAAQQLVLLVARVSVQNLVHFLQYQQCNLEAVVFAGRFAFPDTRNNRSSLSLPVNGSPCPFKT